MSDSGKKGFTLIELLVVISVIALLMAILIPALATAKWLGYRVLCTNNLRQIVIACTVYAEDNEGKVPPAGDRLHPNIFYVADTGYFLPWMIKDYVDDALDVWSCPNIRRFSPPIGDPRNKPLGTKDRYGSYQYFAGRLFPAFDNPDEAVPLKLTKARSTQPLIQDLMKHQFHPAFAAHKRGYHSTHARTGRRNQPNPHFNPSHATILVQEKSDMLGANIGFFGGSSRWVKIDDLVNVGQDWSAVWAGYVYSVMP